MKLHEVCAVVVTFEPDEDIRVRLERLLEQFAVVIVVDNASSKHRKEPLLSMAREGAITLFENSLNVGVAGALNQGLTAAMEQGFSWAVTFDQDSEPDPGLAHELCSELNRRDARQVALIGPRVMARSITEHETKWLAPYPRVRFAFRRIGCSEHPGEVTSIITSGALTNLEAWQALGGFESSLFIDYVDTEYCLRAIRNGYKVIACCSAVLWHNLGNRRRVVRLGRTFSPTFHSPMRHYYIARNRIHVIRKHGLAVPHWFVADLCIWIYSTLRVLLAEDQRMAKLKAGLVGTVDGLLGRAGPTVRAFKD